MSLLSWKNCYQKTKKCKSDDSRLEWIHHDGGTYLAPVSDRMNKISNFRRSEQVFRVYVTVYCGANPNRSKEIWQYVSVISTTSANFVWDNIYEYDVTFRHLMAFNPCRSWAVTYNQMWNICMHEPLQSRSNFSQQRSGNFAAGKSNGSGSSNNNGNKKHKSDYCWNFNKGLACKYGKKCRFVERCSFCDSESHGVVKCPKLEKKNGPSE